jgi:outer membrane biosynthesis protein TonB
MICPKCGEENSDGFRFCGMCGTLLEARRPVGAPRVAGAAEAPRTAQSGATEPRTRATSATSNATMGADQTVPPTAGPSFLGLNQPSTDGPDRYGPTFDSLREKSFSGLDSFFEPEEPKIGARRIVLLLILLVALGAAGWWAFSNYNKMGAALSGNSQTAATKPADTTPDNSASNPRSPADTPSPSNAAATNASPGNAGPAQPAATTPPAQSQNANPAPIVEEKAEPKSAEKEEPKVPPSVPAAAKPADKGRPSREQKMARADTSTAPRPPVAPASDNKGDAEFRKGEAYLYGRGAPENCGEAVKNLKAASAKQNAKARSAFGTMYATGHCVARDLPTSYSWFALALQADPNNKILEKDLVAVWNQMTPPERQMATRSKQ